LRVLWVTKLIAPAAQKLSFRPILCSKLSNDAENYEIFSLNISARFISFFIWRRIAL